MKLTITSIYLTKNSATVLLMHQCAIDAHGAVYYGTAADDQFTETSRVSGRQLDDIIRTRVNDSIALYLPEDVAFIYPDPASESSIYFY